VNQAAAFRAESRGHHQLGVKLFDRPAENCLRRLVRQTFIRSRDFLISHYSRFFRDHRLSRPERRSLSISDVIIFIGKMMIRARAVFAAVVRLW
jgi:hypothetical protein